MSDIDTTLNERQSTHGEFRDNSRISKKLRHLIKEELRQYGKLDSITCYQEEALFHICHKLARAIVGNDKFADHWRDISGYAKLVSDRLEQDFPESQKSLSN